MTNTEQKLNAKQEELVAVGASVGAGCRPCLAHHLQAGATAGLEGERLLAAVASAERVSAEAAVAIGDHARAKLGPGVAAPVLLSRLEEALASLGAALAANDPANIERHLRTAAGLGASRSQLRQAITTAHSVQETAARIHLREAERVLDAVAPETAGPEPASARAEPDDGCGCGTSESSEGRTKVAEPAGAQGAAVAAGPCRKEV